MSFPFPFSLIRFCSITIFITILSLPYRVNALQERVLSWYAKEGRSLPWRKTRDPYKILVSEMMLQQTQVDRVIPKYLAFLEAFPTMEELAAAPTGDVLRFWSGLGYNRRALNLQKCAQLIVANREGEFPRQIAALLSLPGVGKYTAAAVLSFAFNKNVPVVDVNIELLFKRMFYNKFDNTEAIARYVLPEERSRDWHNALMDIGALFCRPKNPNCGACPLQDDCASAHKVDRIEKTWTKKKVVPFKQSDRIVRGGILKLLTQQDGQSVESVRAQLQGQGIEREDAKKDELVLRKGNTLWLP